MYYREHQFSFKDSSDANKYQDETEDEAQRELRDEEAQQCQPVSPMPSRKFSDVWVSRKASPVTEVQQPSWGVVKAWGVAVNGRVIPAIVCSSRETAVKAANTVSKKSWNTGKVVEVVSR